jgi:hypothetical protein
MSSRFPALLLSGTALLATTLPAFAIEPKAVADALVAVLAVGNATEGEYDEAVLEGGDVVIRGLRLIRGDNAAGSPAEGESAAAPEAEADAPDTAEAKAASDDEGTIAFAETRIENPTEGGAGIFDSPRIAFNGGTIEGKSSGTIGGATLVEVSVLDPETIKGDEPGKGLLFRTAEMTDLSIKPEDKPTPITIGRMFMETGDVVDNVPQTNKGTVENITLPPEVFAESAMGPQTIGYGPVVLGLAWDGSRDLAADTINVRDFTVSMQDGGEFSMAAILGKLPAANTMNDADASSKASQVEVHTITLRYDDNSLAGRILDYLAKQQGIERQAYADQIAAALPFMLAALNNPEFQNEVAGAVGAFLKDPQSLTIKIEPAAPVSASEIIGLAGSAPGTLPDRLNASVTANTAETP